MLLVITDNLCFFPVLTALEVECGTNAKGIKRLKTNHMDFSHYEVCSEEGEWETRVCQIGSMFWTLAHCCIPLGSFPIQEFCL